MIVECACGKKMRLSDDKEGAKIRCPGCRTVIVARPASQVDADISQPASRAPVSRPRRQEVVRDDEFEDYEDDTRDEFPDNEWDEFEEEEERQPRRRASRRPKRDRRPAGRRDSGGKRSRGRGPRPDTCPECRSRHYTKVGWTLWGGVFGSMMLSHVRCDDCRKTFNRRTGKSNDTAILIFVGVSMLLGFISGLVIYLTVAA